MKFAFIPGQFKYALSPWFFACGLFCVFLFPVKLTAQNSVTVASGDVVNLPAFSSAGCSYKWTNNNTAVGLKSNGIGDIPSFTAINNGTVPITATITATPTSDGYAYIANSSLNTVSVFNTANRNFVKDIPVDNQPWAVAVSPDGTRIYVLSINDVYGHAGIGTVSVIDAAQNKVISTIPVGKNAGSIVVSPDGKKAYVANKSSNTISIIDLTNNTVSDIPITYALSVAISNDGKTLYVTADGNASTGTLYAINTADNSIIKTVPIGLSPDGIVVSADGNSVYLTNDYLNTVSVINTKTYAATTIPVGQAPYSLAITPDGKSVYVSNFLSKSVSVINTAINTVVQTISIQGDPQGISVSPSGNLLYVTSVTPDMITVINPSNNQIISSTPWPGQPNSTGNFISAGIGCNNVPVVFTVTVNPPPVITDPGTIPTLSAQYGTDGATQTINISAGYLKEGLVITAPDSFEVSTDNITFSNTVTVGDIPPTPIYVRLKSKLPAGSYTGNMQLTSTGASTVNTPISGTVTPAPLIVTADNKHKFLGDDNPVFTVKYTGFVNTEDSTQLISMPVITTTAGKSSPVGLYPITISGAVAANYTISYVPGVLEVISGTVSPPNAFTPNGDGINDNWEIKHLDLYTNCTVEVLNRYGQKVYYSNGYPAPWNGKLNGTNLPVGTYYYIIKLGNSTKPVTGYLAILR